MKWYTLRRESIRSLCYSRKLTQMKVVDAWTAASLVVREQKKKVDWSKLFFWNDTTHVPPFRFSTTLDTD